MEIRQDLVDYRTVKGVYHMDKDQLRIFLAADFLRTRKALGLTQEEISELLGINPRSYTELEHGRNLCSARTLLPYLLRCRTDLDMFLEEAGKILLVDAE